MPWAIEPFERGHHDRDAFDCGTPALNHYLQRQATKDLRRGLARVDVAVDHAGQRPAPVAAFHTLASSAVRRETVGDERVPYEAVPAVLIGRLAVDRRHDGQALGRWLLMDALTRACA